ncbi:hypothetical protein [Trueperella pecoris]|uniref:ThiF family protein n=1 Tax=Trueperella pecoris TaxID=2733571 RepID=A0A7M1QVJ3_9ACTO|nr:hypothetical protein [Trueperella pecoris]QOQ39215.1 hypothetical protein HLG82_07015 [Trueperella pecoris]QOR46152.1 hypothetical protein INS88_02760 [Trueperella pecoris]QTG75978.1 hypothetical protein J4179_02665 [Trueperella pecoris]
MQLTTAVFWTDRWQAQVGLDPRIAISLDGLSKEELGLVDSLTRAQEEPEVKLRARVAGIAPERLRSILSMLERAGVLVNPSVGIDHQPWRRIRNTLPQRAGRHVHIARVDYLGAGIALALARCGIGTITTDDIGTVASNDHPAMKAVGLGRTRSQALKTLLRREAPHIRFGKLDSGRRPDLAVVSGAYASDPVTVGMLLGESVPVYQAWIEEIDLYVGPLSIPHETACGSCLMLHREDLNPHWRTICRQACAATALVPETTSAMMAISLAARDIVAWFDGAPAPDMWRVGPAPSVPEQLVLEPHPSCGCTASHGAA